MLGDTLCKNTDSWSSYPKEEVDWTVRGKMPRKKLYSPCGCQTSEKTPPEISAGRRRQESVPVRGRACLLETDLTQFQHLIRKPWQRVWNEPAMGGTIP